MPEYSVSEISQALKRTVEDTFSYVRVRGELSRVKIHTSGHLYSDLKDDQSVINLVCWRGNVAKLALKPEEGLEVICTGKLSTYPGRSSYQMVVETMELAGEGALLKMLEERKKRLAAEGLFDESRKKPIPFLPKKIGVVTSPTGAVIRDILHRLSDRFPRDVMIWPVRVQGETAAGEVTKAIEGFNALPEGQRPDLLIVARGGGSLEDLMAFNEENVVRAVAASTIPVISAVGHETDTTLVDYVSDKRAPTPTGAAELAVPRRDELYASTLDLQKRLHQALSRNVQDKRQFLDSFTQRLSDPMRLIESKMQSFDFASQRLQGAFEKGLLQHQTKLRELIAKLKSPSDRLKEVQQALSYRSETLIKLGERMLEPFTVKLQSSTRMLESLSFERVLDRGFALVTDAEHQIIDNPKSIKTGDQVNIQFKGKVSKKAVIDGASGTVKKQKPKKKQLSQLLPDQGDLF